MLPIPKFVRLFYIISLVAGDYSSPVTGVYNARSGANLWVCQMKLNVETKLANFEFILNNDARRNLTYPKYFKLENMDYEFNDLNSTISFLTNPEDSDREVVRDMVEYFAPLGDLKIPIEAAWTEDGSIVASILVLDIELIQGDEIDMENVYQEMKTDREAGIETSLFIEETVSDVTIEPSEISETTTSESTSTPPTDRTRDAPRPLVAAAKSVPVQYKLSLPFFIATVLFASFPLAQGAFDWLIYA
jgi:hypothetical protein